MMTTDSIVDVAKAIQLALAPVFLLTGIAGMLNVMAGRLARIIDRGRALTENRDDEPSDSEYAELHNLERRRAFVGTAITASTIAALLLCLCITTLFVEVMLTVPLNWLVGVLFILATLALVVGLGFFLREVHMATLTVRIKTNRNKKQN